MDVLRIQCPVFVDIIDKCSGKCGLHLKEGLI